MINSLSEFRDSMRNAGLEPPEIIEAGKLYRFPGGGKRNGNTAGWCKLFDDGLGGCFGDWSTGVTENWQINRNHPLTSAERDTFHRHVAEAKVQAEVERKARQTDAAAKALEIWNASLPATDDHAYLIRKGIKACGAHLHNDALLIPMRNNGELYSLQFIGSDSKKRFLTSGLVAGCYFSIGTIHGATTLCIAEGYATGATIHQATGYPVAVAFTAGNLKSVAETMRKRFPTLSLIICADDDVATEGNPGLTKATEAAFAVGGMLAVPDFGPDHPDDVTDFNDMAMLRDIEAVNHIIKHASEPANGKQKANEPSASPDQQWPEPQSLTTKVDPAPYPLDALPDTIRSAVEEVQRFIKAPVALVASSALAALSLAVQTHADAKRAEKLSGPAGLFLLTIADSGERKSTCDGFFTKSIRNYEEAQAELAKPELKDHKAAIEAWEAKRGGIKDQIRQLAKSNKPTSAMESALRALEHEKPESPRVPRLLYGDATPEALAYKLATQWPSGGVVSAEAGIVFGAHGMGQDSVMRNLALLNILWDGGDLTIDRRTSDSFTVRGARLTIALQVQEATLRSFFDRSGTLARGTGFLARFLISWPESTQGFRPFTEPPTNWPALEVFNQRIAAILEQPAPIDDEGVLTPPMLPLTPEAKEAWIAFHDAIESDLASGCELYDVRDVASKSADNAVRLAALFQMVEGAGGAIGVEAFESASRVAAWHLNEARRFFGELALPSELADATRLDSWLINYCRRKRTHIVPRREIQRNVTPIHIRQKSKLDDALRELTEAGRVFLVHDGHRKEIHVNPALLIEGGSA